MSRPDVSVVMSVYDDEPYVVDAISDILAQEDVDLEFVIVDDGSAPSSAAILEAHAARDPRVRLVRQENRGLTAALIRGCSMARGRFIARQDADDRSAPRRLRSLLAAFRDDPRLVLASSWEECIGPEDELLFVLSRPIGSEAATAALREGRVSPSHGSVMFLREAYERIGGYRPELRYAQDGDLFLRLAEIGTVTYVPEVLYRYRLRVSSISGTLKSAQALCGRAVQQLRAARAEGRSEAPVLEALRHAESQASPRTRDGEAEALRFIGQCLLARKDSRALPYLWRSVRAKPSSVRSIVGLCSALVLSLRHAIAR
jgi:glycosyltransferase involved in cell wall biosynthesis